MPRPVETLSVVDEPAGGPRDAPRPHLVFVICADRWSEPSRRIRLDPGPVVLGRGPTFQDGVDDGERRVGMPDARMSGRHARLTTRRGRTVLEDLGSKNGTLVNGVTVDGARTLDDGDIVEVGHSFFVFRSTTSTWPQDDDEPRSLADIQTLHGPLAARYEALARVAPSALPILIQGESGVGKEVVAQAIHLVSGRTGALVAINCGALPENLIESELFGVARGAFSGADADRRGLIESASGGTLFLDEIGELPWPAQAKLLRALQEQTVVPVGATRPIPVDFRLISATHRDLERLVAKEAFRGDLFARITGLDITIPPLRARREDIGLLLRRFVEEGGRTLDSVRATRVVARAVMHHNWRYNVRELRKALELALTLSPDGVVDLEHMSLDPVTVERPGAPELTREDEANRDRLIELLEIHHGNVARVASEMGKGRMQIHRWLERYRIDVNRYRSR